jgi:cell division protease FtsH
MSEEVGLVSADAAGANGAPSSALQSQIDTAMRALIREQAERAEALVRTHRGAVEAVAEALIERDVLDADDVIRIAHAHGVAFEQQLAAAA